MDFSRNEPGEAELWNQQKTSFGILIKDGSTFIFGEKYSWEQIPDQMAFRP